MAIDTVSDTTIAVAGDFNASWTAGPAVEPFATPGASDVFVMFLDSAGTAIFASSFGSAARDECTDIVANDHAVLVSATTGATVAFPPDPADATAATARVPPNAVLAFYTMQTTGNTRVFTRTNALEMHRSSATDGGHGVGLEPTPSTFRPSVGWVYRFAWGGVLRGRRGVRAARQ